MEIYFNTLHNSVTGTYNYAWMTLHSFDVSASCTANLIVRYANPNVIISRNEDDVCQGLVVGPGVKEGRCAGVETSPSSFSSAASPPREVGGRSRSGPLPGAKVNGR